MVEVTYCGGVSEAGPSVELACQAAAPLLGSTNELAQPVETMRDTFQTDPEAITTPEARNTALFLSAAAQIAADLAATFHADETAPDLAAALVALSNQLTTTAETLATGHTAQHGQNTAAELVRTLEAIDTTTAAHGPAYGPAGQ